MDEHRESGLAAQLERRRTAFAQAWDADGAVVVAAGDPIHVPGRGDRTYPFHAHSEYLYLTDLERPGGILAFDPQDGWTHFVVPVTAEELLWSGTEDMEPGVPDGARPVDELHGWLEQRAGRPLANLGAPLDGVSSDDALQRRARDELTRLRRVKDDVELARMRVAAAATGAGFAALAAAIAPGATERELQIELEATFLRSGADALAFDSIVAAGPHAAVLHFAPTRRAVAAGELVLVDAGGEFRGYASDVTRTYAASGTFAGAQRHLYDAVLRANRTATELCRPGVQWRDVHRQAALVVGEGLVDLGVLRGDLEALFESGAITLFFPHGVGHMVGLGVRDAGGTREPQSPAPGFPALRVDLPLATRYTMTVEPGVYFVEPLLREAAHDGRYREFVSWERVDELRGFGGIRIEDNIVVTDDGCEVLTAAVPA
ncbi:MAG TPA: aminopeptidase P N-terminal domain-containing protein [Gaiellaceae bacterium]|nr:aminopeptidase P N-terminal domain-containing protein [Gaiellaceae bacterium]